MYRMHPFTTKTTGTEWKSNKFCIAFAWDTFDWWYNCGKLFIGDGQYDTTALNYENLTFKFVCLFHI